MASTSNDRYVELRQKANDLIDQLKDSLKDMDDKAAKQHGADWGFAGSMEKVVCDLREIVAFMG